MARILLVFGRVETRRKQLTNSRRLSYQLVRQIAEGGMGEIHLAHQNFDSGIPSHLAIKMIRPALAENERFLPMFEREARIGQALDHPNIVRTFEQGSDGGAHFIVMEHIDGLSLYQCLKVKRSLPIPVALKIAAEVAAGLGYVHSRRNRNGKLINLIHRDISPGNILLSFDGEVKIADFGIAKVPLAANDPSKTQIGVIKGKFAYLAPEIARAEEFDGRADIFSLGLLLYEMTTGYRAYTGSDEDVLDRAARRDLDPPKDLVADYPNALQAVVMKALALRPRDRYPTAEALQQDLLLLDKHQLPTADMLGRYVRSLAQQRGRRQITGPGVTPVVGLPPFRKPSRKPWHILIGCAAVLTLTLAAIVGATSNSDAPASELPIAPQPVITVSSLTSEPKTEMEVVDPPTQTKPRRTKRPRKRKPRRSNRQSRATVLQLSCTPPVVVYLAGRRLGRTPLRVKLPARRKTVTLMLQNGKLGIRVKRRVKLRGKSTKRKFQLRRGKIVFQLGPGKHVSIDGKPLGASPLPPQQVWEGKHLVQITTAFRYQKRRHKVIVPPNRTVFVRDR